MSSRRERLYSRAQGKTEHFVSDLLGDLLGARANFSLVWSHIDLPLNQEKEVGAVHDRVGLVKERPLRHKAGTTLVTGSHEGNVGSVELGDEDAGQVVGLSNVLAQGSDV